jgi:hypothetical protein
VTYLEQQFDHLLENGQQPTVVDSDAARQQRQNVHHLRQLLVVTRKRVERVGENLAKGTARRDEGMN